MTAAANVTTEMATYGWLSTGNEVQHQTGRHALWVNSMPTQVECADGRFLNTGVLPRTPKQFAAMVAWLDELGLNPALDAQLWDYLVMAAHSLVNVEPAHGRGDLGLTPA